MGQSRTIRANVLLISFNHSPFIRQAIRGLLEQQHALELSIIVADDCSTDGTADIIARELLDQPYETIFLRREKNLGILKNYEDAFSRTDGAYIFILEGDDYWVDPFRLQKHVDFLESNPECVMTMNRFTEYFQESGEQKLPDWPFSADHILITTRQLAEGDRLGNLSACCIRTDTWRKVEQGLFDMPVADWMIGMALGEHGSIALLKEPMSVYRKSASGLWSGMHPEQERAYLLELIALYDRFLGFRYHTEFESHKKRITASSSVPKPPGLLTRIRSGLNLFR